MLLNFQISSNLFKVGVQNHSEKTRLVNLILSLCKTWATFCHCFVHQDGRFITRVKARNSMVFAGYLGWIPARDISKLPKYPPPLPSPPLPSSRLAIFWKIFLKISFMVFILIAHRIHVNYSCNLESVWLLKCLGKVPPWLLIFLFHCPFTYVVDCLAT